MSPEELGTFLSNLVTIEDCFECPIESKAKLFEKTYDAYLLAQSVTRVYGVESPPGQSAMKKLRAEMKACSDRDLLEEYLDYQDRENKRIESIWGEW
jgi:hypothetical protein